MRKYNNVLAQHTCPKSHTLALFFQVLCICFQFTAVFKYIKKYRDIYNVNHAPGHMCQHVGHVGVGWRRELRASKEEGMKVAAILAVDSWL